MKIQSIPVFVTSLLLCSACTDIADIPETVAELDTVDSTVEVTPAGNDEQLAAAAVAAEQDGDFELAASFYVQLQASSDPWYAWLGTSGQVAIHRMTEDHDAARAVTAQLRADQPERTGLTYLWDGDTAALAGDRAAALAAYQLALDEHADELVAGQPLGIAALRQISHVQLGAGDPRAAAATLRELVRRYPGSPSAEFELASAITYDAMAEGLLPISRMGVLLHDGECFDGDPCELASGGREAWRMQGAPISLGGIDSLRFALDDQDQQLREAITNAAASDIAAPASAGVCVNPVASSGFAQPMANDHSGYSFMNYPDSTNGYHPGLDINGPGAGDADCGLVFKAASVGCVTDSTPVDWGSATVQSLYSSRTWTQQYGHASSIYYSLDAAVAKGASLGVVGKVGAASCHLHFEIREQDHPDPRNANYYNTGSQTNVGDWYQDPFPFIAAQRSYVTHRWIDENSFTFYGTWSTIAGVGNEDDMRYALTTAVGSKTNYARYTFVPTATRAHQIYAFVPWNNATSTAASIKLLTANNGTLISKTVNQNVLYDTWVYIGQANLTANTSYYLEVASNTGEASRRVGIDDFLLLGI